MGINCLTAMVKTLDPRVRLKLQNENKIGQLYNLKLLVLNT